MSIQQGNDRAHTYQEIARQARIFNPDVVAITIVTADVPEVVRTLRLLHSISPNATIVGGGPHPSGEPMYTLKQMPELDAIAIGPGEEICLDLANGRPVSETTGCAFLDDKQLVLPSARRTTTHIDSFPFPRVGRFRSLPGSPSYVDLVKQRRIDPATVDWEQLGNFTLLDGPCFANIDPRRFRKILYDFNDCCNAHYRVGFVRNNAERFPDIVRSWRKCRHAKRLEETSSNSTQASHKGDNEPAVEQALITITRDCSSLARLRCVDAMDE